MSNVSVINNMPYAALIKDGESFWNQHTAQTLFEIRDCLNIMDTANYLPECFWKEICDIHATNYSSIYNLTKRMIDADYPGVFMKIKPNRQFLKYIYDELCKANSINLPAE